MPTTGWYCQTSGSARRRVTKNTSPSETEGVYDVKGVPGHTHNASAVISVDADYTKYRTSSITVDNNVWSVGPYNFPIGLLTGNRKECGIHQSFPGNLHRAHSRAYAQYR